MFKLKFETDNAAFDDPNWETHRILKHIADVVLKGETSGKVMDSNGNSIGEWSLSARPNRH